ncbi:PBSX family phage terminase large subunit [Thermomonospora cellulosilytica]|uniref:PBSX family phage terminase large subunit n=1 Tax=Thermomonospora cellulosilytica TaxID=1411118 RepID=A0A7W3MXJ1_9ACTN|nr:PBSX family phage terminase large subunit [Thermomonospora cellulosilytica]MBA9003747.1 PBSX family phage terminase large subunit [Thermomonospora cellulosilytica]
MTDLLDALPLSRKQVDYVVNSTAFINLSEGSIRSGKTISSLLRWLIYVANAPRGGELVVVGRTRDSLARNVFGPLMDPGIFGPLAKLTHYTPGAATATILGRTIHVLGASDAKAEKVLRGLTCAGAYVDELTVIAEDFFQQLIGRCSVPGAQIFCTTNPDSPAHWVRTRFLDRLADLPDWRVWHFTLDDNPALPDEVKQRYHRQYTGLWRRRFILGEWVAAEGAIYDMWDPDTHVVPWEQLPTMARLIGVGLDYGTTNPTAGILLGVSADGRLYLVDEWRHDPKHDATRLTDGQLSASFRDWLAKPHLPTGQTLPIEWIVADPSAASFRTQLAVDGIHTARADNDVLRGIGLTATLLTERRLLVADRCRGFIREAPGYSWDPDATLKGLDEPIKVADHSLDAGRYILATTEELWRPMLRSPLGLAA